MGAGRGAGRGSGKGVKGSWRVNAFLLLLTGWQAVLLPWSPLILREAGFSATSVGVLSGGIVMAGSVGVVVCLQAMRRSRSGAVRRLLLWLMLATAVLLQGFGMGLDLQHLSQGGAMPSCVSGWLFGPAAPAFAMNNASTPATPHLPHAVSPQQPHNSTLATTTQPSPPPPPPPHPLEGSHGADNATSPHTHHNTPHRPAPTTTTTTTTTTPAATNSTTSTGSLTFIPLIPVQPVTTTATTTTTTTTPVPTSPVTDPPFTTTSTHPTVAPGGTSNKTFEVNKDGTLTYGEDGSTEAPHRPPVGHGKHHDKTPSKHHHHNDAHQPAVTTKKSGRGKNVWKTKYHSSHQNAQVADDNDGNNDEYDDDDDDYNGDEDNDDYSQDVDKYDEPEGSEEDEVDKEDDPPKSPNYRLRSGSSFRPSAQLPPSAGETLTGVSKAVKYLDIPLNSLHRDAPAGTFAEFLNALNSHRSKLSRAPKRKQNEGHTPLLRDQDDLRIIQTPRHSAPPGVRTRRPHHPSRMNDQTDGRSHYKDYDFQSSAQHTSHGRGRRDVSEMEGRSGVHADKAAANTKPRHNESLEGKQRPSEEVKTQNVQVGVAVLLVLGSLAGAGVEAAVAQLWHCIVHGYDESGVSHDVLQRTITHTFHLSAYGNHKTWTGISALGWVIGAGVVSILTCLAGTGGGGYAGLLGVHVALGVGALLFLLVLPVPYGSIDPPKTRRPLSLYLDDEVLREGLRRLTFHIWVFINGCLAALSITFSLWLLQEMTTEGWLVSSQASAVGMTLVCESLALHTQRRFVCRWGLHGLMGVCGVSLMLHYGFMWATSSAGVVVAAHAGLGVAMAFLWVAVKHNALLLATVSDQEREAWASWWCWRLGLGVGSAVWGVAVSGTGERVQPLLFLATITAALLATGLCMTAVLSRRNSRTRRRVYHTLDLDIVNDEIDEEEEAAEDDWLVKRAKKEGLSL